MRTLIPAAAFDFEELRFDYGDVVLAAIGWREWESFERSLAEGLACVSAADRDGEEIDAEALRASLVAFRRSHQLLAGEDYLRWLDDRSLSTREMDAHLRRQVLRLRAGQRLEGLLEDHRPGSAALGENARAEAILGGWLRRWAERLARCAAASHRLAADEGEAPGERPVAVSALLDAAAGCPASGLTGASARDRAPRVAALLAAEQGLQERVVTPEEIERRLSAHRLDWQRLRWQEALFASEGAAREAALWVRDQGLALHEVASMARATTSVREAYCAEVPEVSGLLMAAVPGELLGPLAVDEHWRLVCLHERTLPGAADPVLRDRASAEIVEDALARHLAGRVSWHGER
jgi:hypothetical protein